ncbi:MAG TPA: TetR/AcrR family transcriptional regulator [Nitrospirae bacterium]|nr:TetR/AcrR family transcriptional regulator [Nitrospirota bacterium]
MEKSGTKERLLESTLKLISGKGYLGATTREIAREAGVTELTLFRHFGSKERLFEEVLNRYTFLPRLRQLLPELEGLASEEALRTVGIRFFETLKERKSLVRIMLSEMNIYPEKIRMVHEKFIDDLIQTLADYFGTLQPRGKLGRSSHKTVARAFLGMVFSYFQAEEIVKERDVTKREMENIIGEFVDIFVHGTMKRYF